MIDDFRATTSQLAEILGVSEELIRVLSRQKVIPKNGRNKFDLREAIPAFYARKAIDDETVSEYETERTRYMKSKADMAEMQAGVQSGQLGYVDEITHEYSGPYCTTRSGVNCATYSGL